MLHMTTDFKSFHLTFPRPYYIALLTQLNLNIIINTDINANANLKTNLTYDGYISG